MGGVWLCFVTFPCGVLGPVWYMIVSIPNLCLLTYLINFRENPTYHFRYNNILRVPQVRSSKFDKKSFRYAAAVKWNRFPDEFRRVYFGGNQSIDCELEWGRL